MEQQQEEKEDQRSVDLGEKKIEEDNKMEHEDNNESQGDFDD